MRIYQLHSGQIVTSNGIVNVSEPKEERYFSVNKKVIDRNRNIVFSILLIIVSMVIFVITNLEKLL